MTRMRQWFEVDRQGLAALVGGKDKSFILHELLQNAWDCLGVKRVEVTVEPVEGIPFVDVSVLDDDPDGFRNLSHSYTLFAPSEKKSNPGRRGRFNLGEKLVLSLCRSATIQSTVGTVTFDHRGRRESSACRKTGTLFKARVRANREEFRQMLLSVERLIPPEGVATFINGERLKQHEVAFRFKFSLPTVLADDGVLKVVVRDTVATLCKLKDGEQPNLYEMGIPVVELAGGEPWHVNVGQKVPLSMERDNVTPVFLSRLRVEILNYVANSLTTEQARATWVTSAMGCSAVDIQESERVCGPIPPPQQAASRLQILHRCRGRGRAGRCCTVWTPRGAGIRQRPDFGNQ
jgi:hypothetical protein